MGWIDCDRTHAATQENEDQRLKSFKRVVQMTRHDTLVFRRTLPAPIPRVWRAFADPSERAIWGVPSDASVVIYDQVDFRVGGTDIARCGDRSDPRYRAVTRYLDIVPERRIVWSEVVDEQGTAFGASLVTVDLEPEGPGTALTVTIQVASFVGDAMIEGTRQGYEASLGYLARYLAGEAAGS